MTQETGGSYENRLVTFLIFTELYNTGNCKKEKETMSHDSADRVPEDNVSQRMTETNRVPYDPIFNPNTVDEGLPPATFYHPDNNFDADDTFGRPATGDGK
jgi:hypothetical protein